MTRFLDLLLEFQSLPRSVRERTFMEVSRYPHYENVCSNILAFYFDPAEEHGLGDLFLTAFLEMVVNREKATGESKGDEERLNIPLIPQHVRISREYQSEGQMRIDLLIDSDVFTIGIENKIYHTEDNDFAAYSATIERIGRDKRTVKAVLCLRRHPGEAEPTGGFLRYTYSEFWKLVLERLGPRVPSASPKWITYLSEFMTTTARLAGETPEEKEVTEFFIRNRDLIDKLLTERQALLSRLDGYISNLHSTLKKFEEHEYITTISVYGKSAFVVDFLIDQIAFALILDHWASEWQLKLLPREANHAPEFLRDLLERHHTEVEFANVKVDGPNWLLTTRDLHATPVELQDSVLKTVELLLRVISEPQSPQSNDSTD